MGLRAQGAAPHPDQMQTTELQLLWTPRDKQLLLLLLQGRTEEEGTGTGRGAAGAQVLTGALEGKGAEQRVKLN